jgi:hypothetical protein
MDTLSDLLASMRLAGGVFLDGEMRGPWSIISQVTPDECAMYFPSAPPSSHVIAYHYVRSGWMECQVLGEEPAVTVRAGQIVLLPRNQPHLLHGPERSEPISGADMVLPVGDDGRYRVRLGEGRRRPACSADFWPAPRPRACCCEACPPSW